MSRRPKSKRTGETPVDPPGARGDASLDPSTPATGAAADERSEPSAPDAVVDAVPVDEPLALAPFPGPARAAPRSVSEAHLRGIIESLVFASDKPMAVGDVAKIARAETRDVRRLLEELREEYRGRGIQLDEIAGGWQFRSSAANAPFVRELLQAKPVKLTRAQVETLAIVAYRQPITRPEIDDVRGVDSGSALKVLLDRELIRMLGRKEDVGRPVLYGTSAHFLEFFGLKSLRDLPTLREFTELTPESEATLVRELGDEAADTTAAPSAGDPASSEPVVPAADPVPVVDDAGSGGGDRADSLEPAPSGDAVATDPASPPVADPVTDTSDD